MPKYPKYQADEFGSGRTDDPRETLGFVGPQLPLRASLEDAGYEPSVATTFGRVAAGVEAEGFDPYLGPQAGVRTKEQAKQNAERGVGSERSKHIQKLAIDLRDRAMKWRMDDPDKAHKYAMLLGRLAEQEGLVWGGDWFKKDGQYKESMPGIGWDPHHIEIDTRRGKAHEAFSRLSNQYNEMNQGAQVVRSEAVKMGARHAAEDRHTSNPGVDAMPEEYGPRQGAAWQAFARIRGK